MRTNHNVAGVVMDELNHRHVLFIDRFMPTMLSSVGCHIFNIENKLRGMHYNMPTAEIPEVAASRQAAKQPQQSVPVVTEMDKLRRAAKQQRGRRQRVVKPSTQTRVVRIPRRAERYPELMEPRSSWLKPIRMQHANVKDSRLHIIYVAPPGASKTLFINQLFKGNLAMFTGTPFHPVTQNSMTGPGWVGTITNRNGDYIATPGEAAEHAMSIHAIEEFHGIMGMLEAGHSLSFKDHMLTSLDSGSVTKSVAGGTLRYETDATLIGGTQPTTDRINLSAGIGRRLAMMFFVPTPEERMQLVDATIDGNDIYPDNGRVITARQSITDKIYQLRDVESIWWDKEVLRGFAHEYFIPHFEIEILTRIAIGWTVMTKSCEVDEIRVDMKDPVIRDLLVKQVNWREKVKFGTCVAMFRETMERNDGRMSLQELTNEMVRYNSLTFEEVNRTLDDMQKYGIVKRTGQQYTLRDYTANIEADQEELVGLINRLRRG